jgi:tetratricopeptide (TPR) repeat protein
MRIRQAKKNKTFDELKRGVSDAATALNANRFDETEAICRRLLANYSSQPELYNLLGFVELGRKRHANAARYFSKAVELAPNNIGYLNNMGRAYLDFDRPELALPPLIRAVTLDPKQVEALLTIARFYRMIGKAELALPYLEKAATLKTNDLAAKSEYAFCLEAAGLFERAEAELDILKKDKAYRVLALASLARSHSRNRQNELLKEISAEITDLARRDGDRAILYYASGKLLEDLHRYDESFDHYRLSNELKGEQFDYTAHLARREMIIELFRRDLMKEHRKFGNASQIPTFVVGMPRSGTTLTEQILASHPAVAGAGEQPRISRIATSFGFRRDIGKFCAEIKRMGSRETAILSRNYLGLLKLFSVTAQRVVDKLPHNFELLGFIALLFPNARVIHCRRNPIDTCVSCYTNSFSSFHSYANDLKTLGLYYRDYDRLMQHWREHLPLRMYELDYERLTQDTESETRKLIAFLDLPWDDRCLAFNERKGVVTTLSQWQVRQPMYTSSVNRWKRFEKHLGPLIEALGDLAVVN